MLECNASLTHTGPYQAFQNERMKTKFFTFINAVSHTAIREPESKMPSFNTFCIDSIRVNL